VIPGAPEGAGALFEPNFKEAKDGKEEFFPASNREVVMKDDGDNRASLESNKSSTVSQWENVDSQHIERALLQLNGHHEEEEEEEAVVLDQNGKVEADSDDESDQHQDEEEVFHEMEASPPALVEPRVPFFGYDHHGRESAEEFAERQRQLLLARRRNIVQLNSQAKEEALAEKERLRSAAKPTWSEAVRNITAEDKMKEMEELKENKEPAEDSSSDSDTGEANDGPVWKLPIEEPKKKANKKKKKKK